VADQQSARGGEPPEDSVAGRAALKMGWLSRGAAALALLVSVAVLASWYALNTESLLGLMMMSAMTLPNVAAGLGATAVAVWLLQQEAGSRRRLVGRVLAALAAVIGALTLLERMFDHDLGIDLPLVRMLNPAAVDQDGFVFRPWPITPLAMLLVALAVLALGRSDRAAQRGGLLADVLAICAGVLAITGLCCMVIIGSDVRQGDPYISMSLPAASAVLLLAIAVLTSRPQAGLLTGAFRLREGEATPRRVLVAAFSIAWLLFAYSVWLALHQVSRGQDAAAEVMLSYRADRSLGHIELLAHEIEFSARGYSTNGGAGHLDAFESKVAAIATEQEQLRQLATNAQRTELAAVESLVTELVYSVRSRIARRQNSNSAAGQASDVEAGFQEMGPIDAAIAAAQEKGVAELGARARTVASEQRAQLFLILGSALLSVGFLVFAFRLLSRANEARRRAETRLDRHFDLSPSLLSIVGVDGSIARVNPALRRHLGYEQTDALPRSVTELAHPDDRDTVIAGISGLDQGVPAMLTIRCQRRDGTSCWTAWNITPVPGEEKMYAAVRDVTEQRAVEELSRQRLKSLVDIKAALDAHSVVAVTDRSGQIIEVNDRFCALSKYSREELIGQNHRLLNSGHHPREFFRQLWATISAGGIWQGEVRNRAKDGSLYWVETTITPFLDDKGVPIQYVAVRTDITAIKEAESRLLNFSRDLRQANQKLSAANAELESFSYSVSHDLRAPLRHVQGYTELLTRELVTLPLSDRAKRHLTTITEASKDMSRLIDDLLAFSRVGKHEVSMRAVPLDGAVQRAIKGMEPALQGRNIEWIIQSLPAVLGDSTMLAQVFVNLISNAVKFSRQRDPARIELGCAGEKDGRAIIFVRDNGVGFDAQYVHKLFGVFQRLHTADEFEGTGIGLAIVQRVINRHGGSVWAESTLDQGATFYLTLQLATPE
jgi:PAS domain S-box-containing protein